MPGLLIRPDFSPNEISADAFDAVYIQVVMYIDLDREECMDPLDILIKREDAQEDFDMT